jgi:hypothetical protein
MVTKPLNWGFFMTLLKYFMLAKQHQLKELTMSKDKDADEMKSSKSKGKGRGKGRKGC